MDAEDPWNLSRFIAAQEPVFEQALAELHAGRKRTHWMWFVFPQHVALGRSGIARTYGMRSVEEARAYWDHPLLGPRLRQCCEALLALPGSDPHAVLGSPDDLKLRSCMTLFANAAPDEPLFQQVLDRYYGSARDEHTEALLR